VRRILLATPFGNMPRGTFMLPAPTVTEHVEPSTAELSFTQVESTHD
jgi:hypothetical protein